MTRGGARPGAGGQKPPLPKGKKRKQYTIRFSPLEMRRIKQAAAMQGHKSYSAFIRLTALKAAEKFNCEVKMRMVGGDCQCGQH